MYSPVSWPASVIKALPRLSKLSRGIWKWMRGSKKRRKWILMYKERGVRGYHLRATPIITDHCEVLTTVMMLMVMLLLMVVKIMIRMEYYKHNCNIEKAGIHHQ